MKTLTKTIFASLILILAFIAAEIVKSPSADSNSNGVGIFFFDVGQGDSALIQKGNFQILIDGGPDDKVLAELGKAMPLTDKKIEIMVLTHPHADHITGLNLILDRYEVGKVYGSGVLSSSSIYLDFLTKLKDKNPSLDVPSTDSEISPFVDARLEFLWPGDKYLKQSLDNLNNSSEVARFCYFSRCLLFTGDIEIDEQTAMLAYYTNKNELAKFQAEILKIPHHGSQNGANQELLDAVKPKSAVISAGKDNQYGHPHQVLLDLLNKNSIQIFQTDLEGTIIFHL